MEMTRKKIAQLHAIDQRVVMVRFIRIGIQHSGKLSDLDIKKYFDTYGWPDKLGDFRASLR
jgi:hypothetical protein